MMNHVVLDQTKLPHLNFFSALKVAIVPIFLALLISNLLDQYLNIKIEHILKSTTGLSPTIWLYGSVLILSSLLFPLLITFISGFAFKRGLTDSSQISLATFCKKYFELSMIETLRVFGFTFLWSFVFLLPGLIKFVLFTPTLFVVFFSYDYELGQVDALDLAQKIAKKFWFKLLIYLLIFSILIPMLTSTFLDQYHLFSQNIFAATGLTLIDSVLTFLFHFLLIKEFFKHLPESAAHSPEDQNVTYV